VLSNKLRKNFGDWSFHRFESVVDELWPSFRRFDHEGRLGWERDVQRRLSSLASVEQSSQGQSHTLRRTRARVGLLLNVDANLSQIHLDDVALILLSTFEAETTTIVSIVAVDEYRSILDMVLMAELRSWVVRSVGMEEGTSRVDVASEDTLNSILLLDQVLVVLTTDDVVVEVGSKSLQDLKKLAERIIGGRRRHFIDLWLSGLKTLEDNLTNLGKPAT